MVDPVTTTALAESNPTPAPPPTTSPADRWAARTSPAAQPAMRDGVIADREYDALPDDRRAAYARVRKNGLDGGSEWVARDKMIPAAEPAQPGTPPASTPAPGDKVKIGDYELNGSDVAMILQTKAAMDLKAIQVPSSAEAYEAKLPEGFKLPDGMTWAFDPKDPALIDAQRFANRAGLTQSQFSELLSVYASQQMAEQQFLSQAAAKQIELLGVNSTARVSAVETFIRGIAGDELGGALRQSILTAKHVQAWEKIIGQFGSQGVASYKAHGREPPGQPGTVSEEQWQGMSQAQRLDYARGFDQSQFRNGR
jgi:hypothetical protein